MNWMINEDFFDRELWAPFHIEKDIEYYDDLCKKYNLLYNKAKKLGADEESLKIIKKYTEKVRKSIRCFYKGEIPTAHNVIKNYIKNLMDYPLAVDYIYSSKAFPGESNEIQFFRARVSDKVTTVFSAKEMLHLPFSMRGKTANYRFSIPGIPSLYLGNSSYACWIELRSVPEYKLNVSPVLLNGNQRILNLAVATRRLSDMHENNIDDVHCWIKLVILMIATSYVIDERDRSFKSEYIISQSIMLGCKELGLDGVAYFSKRVHDEAFANAAINLALFTNFKKGKLYSEICNNIKVDESFNYSMYKQLGIVDRHKVYEKYRLKRTGRTTNIGNYKRQFDYADTEFCAFDKFLFATWKDKDKIEFGNALSDSKKD